MKTYTPPSIKIHRDWENTNIDGKCLRVVDHPDYTPTIRQLIIIDATREAIEQIKQACKYPYTIDVNNIVAKLLNVSNNDPLRHSTEDFNVQGGIFGYDVYNARRYIEKQDLVKSNLEAIANLNLSIGAKIGKIKINNKIANACLIDGISKTGISIKYTKGRFKYTSFIERISRIKSMAEEANNYIFEGAKQ